MNKQLKTIREAFTALGTRGAGGTKNKMKHPSYWASEFPDFSEITPEVAAMRHAGLLADISWGQDVCPSFILIGDLERMNRQGSTDGIRVLWVDHPVASQREMPDAHRFLVSCDEDAKPFDDEQEAIRELMRPVAAPQAQDLAYKFAALLREELGDEIEDVIARNQSEPSASICHSHDFTDANDVMADAFRQMFGRKIDLQNDADRAIWNSAWDLAKASEFETDCVTDDERSNGPRR